MLLQMFVKPWSGQLLIEDRDENQENLMQGHFGSAVQKEK